LPPSSPPSSHALNPSLGASTRRPSPWPAVWGFVAALVLALVSSILLVFVIAWVRVSGDRARLLAEANAFALSPGGLMVGALGNAAVLGAVALFTARLQGPGIIARLGLGATRASPLGTVAAVAGMLGLSVACGAASELLGVRGTGVMDTMGSALRAPSAGRFVAALLAIGVAPGIAEETFFRGSMQTRLVASWGRWPGIVATAAAFGLIHLDLVQGSLAFVAGLYLGWIVERFGGIRPTIAAHIANNALFVTLAALGAGDAGSGSRLIAIAVVAGGSVLWLGSIALLRQSRATTAPSEH
jgi:membrane protease YdiL (CAAX protease family)